MENNVTTPEDGRLKNVAPDYEKMYFDLWAEMEKVRAESEARRQVILANDREIAVLRGQMDVIRMVFGNR